MATKQPTPKERFGGLDLAKSPVVTIWEVTQACDLVCKHCRADAQPHRRSGELTTAEGLRLLEQAVDLGTRLFVFTGGDPLKRPDLTKLIGHAKDLNLHPSVTPSVTPLLTTAAIEEMADAGAEAIALSLDGDDAELHDGFRGWSGSFDQTLRAAAAVRAAGLRLQINTTVTRFNLDRLEAIARHVTELGAMRWSVFFLVPIGRGAELQVLSPAEHERVYEWLVAVEQRMPFAVKATEAPAYRRVLMQHKRPPRLPVSDGRGFCFISHTGEVFPSGFLPVSAGNVRRSTLTELYRESELFRALRDPSLLKGRCGICNYREVCGGSRARAYAMTGDYLAEETTCAYEPAAAVAAAGS